MQRGCVGADLVDGPFRVEHRAVDGVAGAVRVDVVQRQLVHVAAETEPSVAESPCPRGHRVRTPPDRAGGRVVEQQPLGTHGDLADPPAEPAARS